LSGDRIVGGLIIAARLDTILQALSASSRRGHHALSCRRQQRIRQTAAPADGLAI
jgi:hypothetical protein